MRQRGREACPPNHLASLSLAPSARDRDRKKGEIMTTVIVNPGACGFTVTIRAEKGKDKKITVALDTSCEMVKAMAGDIKTLNVMSLFIGFQNNPVYQSAARRLKHSACPVPGGILKAIEVEAGMNLPRDVSIVFLEEP